jgi:DNA-binding LacI/PurR family transcriptional regulator
MEGEQSQSAALARTLRYMIQDGRFVPQEPLPPQRELSSRFKVGVQVVRSAMSMLEEEGLLFKRQRRGVFIRSGWSELDGTSSRGAIQCINFLERPTGTSPGFVRSGYLQGYSQAMENLDVKMRFLPCPENPESWESLFNPQVAPEEQGCVLINLLSAPLMRWLSDRGVPFVVQSNRAYATSDYPPHHSLSINKVRGGFEAARHLIGLGHRRIGFIGQLPPENVWNSDVYGGCLSGISHAGLHFHKDDLLNFMTNEPAMAVEPIRRFLDRPERPSGIVTQNDAVALGVLEVARQIGLRVPEDLSVVGFDDVPEAELSNPPLTTFANPRVLLGRAVVQTLLEVAAGRVDGPRHRVLEGQLVVRGSSGPPAGAEKI